VCSGSFSITCYTCEESWRRFWEDLSAANFLLSSHQVRRKLVENSSSHLFLELTLEEPVFLS
jgi:hypothetical protein